MKKSIIVILLLIGLTLSGCQINANTQTDDATAKIDTQQAPILSLSTLSVFQTDDLYHSNWVNEILSIKTYSEKQWLERGLSIKYIQFKLTPRQQWEEPTEEIEEDDYRSFNRSRRSAAQPTE